MARGSVSISVVAGQQCCARLGTEFIGEVTVVSRDGRFRQRGVPRPARGANVWIRGVVGVGLCLVGIVFILQGTNVIHGSGMSGHGGYAGLGGVLVVAGVALLGWAWRARSGRTA